MLVNRRVEARLVCSGLTGNPANCWAANEKIVYQVMGGSVEERIPKSIPKCFCDSFIVSSLIKVSEALNTFTFKSV